MSGTDPQVDGAGEASSSPTPEPSAPENAGTVSPSQYGKPAPQFGVYASPEEQRARIRRPDATGALDAGLAADPVPPSQEAPAGPGRSNTPAPYTAKPPTAVAATPHVIDRIVTFALLGYGLITVLLTVGALTDVSGYVTATYELMGIPGSFTVTPFAQAAALIASVALIGGYLLTAVFSVRRTLRRRRAWWVPLAGAAVTQFAYGLILTAALLSDPAFTSYATSLR